MATKLIQSECVFLDTAYAVALASVTDELHAKAFTLVAELKTHEIRLLTTWAVLLEIGNALSRLRFRESAIRLLTSLQTDPTVEIVPLSNQLLEQSFGRYSARRDKEWSFTDCVSFVVMEARNLTEALTADEHFRQAGFRALLRETTG